MLNPAAQKSGYFSKKKNNMVVVLGSGSNYLSLVSVYIGPGLHNNKIQGYTYTWAYPYTHM